MKYLKIIIIKLIVHNKHRKFKLHFNIPSENLKYLSTYCKETHYRHTYLLLSMHYENMYCTSDSRLNCKQILVSNMVLLRKES